MTYTTSRSTSDAVFYYGDDDEIGVPGEVDTNDAGEIIHVRIGKSIHVSPLSIAYNACRLQNMGITRITYKVAYTLDLKNGERPV